MFEFDESDPVQAMALGRLRTEVIAWLTTVDSAGSPRSIPVWFYLHDGLILIISEPNTAKVRHVLAGSATQLHLHTGASGDEVVILDGTTLVSARSTEQWMAEIKDGYRAKYDEAIEAYGMPLAQIVEQFSTVLEFAPTRLRAW